VTFWCILSYTKYEPHGEGGVLVCARSFTQSPTLVLFVMRGYLEASCFWLVLVNVIISHSARQHT